MRRFFCRPQKKSGTRISLRGKCGGRHGLKRFLAHTRRVVYLLGLNIDAFFVPWFSPESLLAGSYIGSESSIKSAYGRVELGEYKRCELWIDSVVALARVKPKILVMEYNEKQASQEQLIREQLQRKGTLMKRFLSLWKKRRSPCK